MLSALKALFRKSDAAPVAAAAPVPTITAEFEEVAAPVDAGVKLRKVYELDPSATAALIAIGMPAEIGRLAYHAEPAYDFEIRQPDRPRVEARRFLAWMRAIKERGQFRSEQVWAMYEEFCLYDHRKPLPQNYLLNALESCAGVSKKRPLLPDGSRDPKWLWTIKPPPFRAALGQAQKTPNQIHPKPDPLPDNVTYLPAAQRHIAHDARRFARRRNRKTFRGGRRVA